MSPRRSTPEIMQRARELRKTPGPAEAWARANNAVTLSQTETGAELNQIMNGAGYNVMRSFAEAASTDWAEGASGTVHVFLGSGINYAHSIWTTIEYPLLMVNDAVTKIIPHMLDQ